MPSRGWTISEIKGHEIKGQRNSVLKALQATLQGHRISVPNSGDTLAVYFFIK